MNRRSNFTRKLTYGVMIAVLLFPLSLLSSPATVESPGGVLAKLRSEHRLGQGDLGEIDPASETIKLATLGLRGLAVNLLWEKANHYKKVEDWTNLTASLEQLAKLQPNFITFWKYQSWNLSYNVSVEFDDYNDRYYWVRRGIQFLQKGNVYNRDNPVLLWELGWVLGQKIGRSDEKVQYRRLFKADDEYHPEDRTPTQRDNWLVSKESYLDSVASVDELGKSLGKKSPIVFYSSPTKSQMNYAEAIEEEGLFDRAVRAWGISEREWIDFGNVPIEHSTGPILYLGQEEELTEEVAQLRERLGSMVEGIEDKVAAALREQLTEEEKAVLEIPEVELEDDQYETHYSATRKIEVTPEKIAEYIAKDAPDKQREAARLAADLRDKEKRRRFTNNYKDTANYDYWLLRSQFEQSDEAVEARELVFRAQRAFREQADPITAKELYEESFDRWAKVFERFPDLKDRDGTTGDDVMVFVYDYKKVLDQLDEPVSEDFPLWEIVEQFDVESRLAIELKEWQSKQPSATGAETPAE